MTQCTDCKWSTMYENDECDDCLQMADAELNLKQEPPFIKLQHPAIHYLKCHTPYFQAMKQRKKKFEKRVWDRDYQVGDNLVLQEWNPGTEYTGDELYVNVAYILEGEFAESGVCLMSVDEVEEGEK